MFTVHRSLRDLQPRHLEVPALLLVSAILLIFGLTLPTVTLKELVFWKHTFSILSGIQNLFKEGHYFLSVIIFLFSVVFPIAKLATLGTLWFARLPRRKRLFLLRWLGALGKWSMLDVFIVAIMIVISMTSGLMSAEPHVGIYIFGASIMLSMIATMRMNRLSRHRVPNPTFGDRH